MNQPQDFDPSRERIGTLALDEWCDYWAAGNSQYLDDGLGVESPIRDELAAASAVMRKLLEVRRRESREAATAPTRELFERIAEQTDCFEWHKTKPFPRWHFDEWFIEIDTIAKLRAACLLLGIEWPEQAP